MGEAAEGARKPGPTLRDRRGDTGIQKSQSSSCSDPANASASFTPSSIIEVLASRSIFSSGLSVDRLSSPMISSASRANLNAVQSLRSWMPYRICSSRLFRSLVYAFAQLL